MPNCSNNIGVDAVRNVHFDFVRVGILDPARVMHLALENAVSVGSLLQLTEATMTDLPQAPKSRGDPPEMAS